MDEAHELKKAVAALGAPKRGKRYPSALLERVVGYGAARRQQGATLISIADELVLSWRSLSRWLSERKAAPRLNRVQVVAPERRDIVVHAGHGVRVEGLDVDGLAELIRKLDV